MIVTQIAATVVIVGMVVPVVAALFTEDFRPKRRYDLTWFDWLAGGCIAAVAVAAIVAVLALIWGF